MTSRTLKLLTASTAFVAAASAGNAANLVSTAVTNTLFTSTTAGPITVVSTGSIIASATTAAIELNATTAASNTVVINTGAVLSATGVTATIQTNGAALSTAANITNAGSIRSLVSTTGAIYIDSGANATNITNSGTISGSVVTAGTGTNTINNTGTIRGAVTNGTGGLTYNGTNATQIGNITSLNTAGTDAVTISHSTVTGNIDLGAGINNAIISASTVTGNYVGGAGVDTVNIKDSSTFTGNISLGAGSDVLNVSNSRVIGNITGAAAAGATATLTNAVVSGTIDLGGTGDADVLTINGQNTYNVANNISNVETINFGTNANINAGSVISGANTVTLASQKTLNVNNSLALTDLTNNGGIVNANQSITGSGLLTNTGTLNIAAGKTVTTGTYASAGNVGKIGIGIASSTVAGKLILTGGGVSTPSITINMGADAGYIASGTSYTIIDGSTASTNATVLNSSSGVYRFSTGLTNGDISLTVTRVATKSVVTGGDNQAAAAAIDTVTNNNNVALKAVHSAIGAQTTAAGVNNVVESLTPSIDGAGAASIGISVDTGNQISNRLASVRSTSGVATGDAMASKHMWLQGFGSTVSQDDKGGNRGYDANSGGVSVGVDTDTLLEGFTTGAAFSYGHASVDSNASSNASTDIDAYVGTIYGSRVFDSGVFVNGQVGGGYNKYDMERNVIGVGKATGDTNGFQGNAKLEAGKDFAVQGFTLTPLASLQYTYLNMDKYTESGAGGASLTVDPEALSSVDAGAGGQVAYAIPLTDGGTLKPSAHAKYIYRMGDTEMGTTSSFTGGGASFNTSGVKADRSSVNLGAGLLLTTVAGTDLSLNYDADIRSNLTGHTGQLKARWAF